MIREEIKQLVRLGLLQLSKPRHEPRAHVQRLEPGDRMRPDQPGGACRQAGDSSPPRGGPGSCRTAASRCAPRGQALGEPPRAGPAQVVAYSPGAPPCAASSTTAGSSRTRCRRGSRLATPRSAARRVKSSSWVGVQLRESWVSSRTAPMGSVRSTRLAAERRAFFSGSAKHALSLSGYTCWRAGSGGAHDLILGEKLGWRVIGNPEYYRLANFILVSV